MGGEIGGWGCSSYGWVGCAVVGHAGGCCYWFGGIVGDGGGGSIIIIIIIIIITVRLRYGVDVENDVDDFYEVLM